MNPQYRAAGGGATARNDAPMQLTPINSLNSYQNRWTVKARVTQKSDIRRYSNARGEGKFFSFDFLDADGGEIRVVGWNDMCDKFFDQVTAGQVYTLTKASLRNKRGNFNQTRHQFEVHLENASVLELVQDEASIPRISFNFVPLSQLEDTPAGTVLDVIGVVESVAEPADITRKDGTQVSKRGVNIRDDSGRSIELTLWGSYVDSTGNELAAAVGSGRHPIVAVKGARVGDYNGKTLSTVSSSTIVIDPVDESKAGSLRSWYDNGGATTAAQALSSARAGSGRSDRRICTSIIKSEGLGLNEKPDYVINSMYILFPRNENFCYPACPLMNNGKQCLKKLIEENPGDFRCERCNAQAAPDYRFIVSCQVADYSGTAWVSMFNETAVDVVGASAGQLRDWDQNDDPRFKLAWKDCQYKEFILKLKISQDTYNDETKLRTNVVALTPVDFVTQTRWNLEAIARLEQNMEAYPKLQQQQGAFGGAVNAGGYGGFVGGYGGGVGGVGGGYGGPAAGAPQYGGGYGGPPQQNNYNQPPQQQQGWGGGPAQNGGGGWGQQQGGGYGAPQQQQQWGAAPVQNGYGPTTTNAGSW
jgi:replication factor A1